MSLRPGVDGMRGNQIETKATTTTTTVVAE